MNGFNLAHYVKKSTDSSSVPLRVQNKDTLSTVVALIGKK
jgi:hypothetical protein